MLLFLFFERSGHHRNLPSSPTRRSSDLPGLRPEAAGIRPPGLHVTRERPALRLEVMHDGLEQQRLDRIHRSEEHTSELQSRQYLVCRLLLEKKKNSVK